MYFNSPGPENTVETAIIAVKEAVARQISHIVAASNTGATVLALAEEAKKQGYNGKLICVSSAYGFNGNGENELSSETREELEKQGIKVCTAAHVLSGAERGLSTKFQGVFPVEIIAHSLRMFSQGTKVCVEISVMALDAGIVPWGKPIIAMAGSSSGSDTALLLTPAYASNIMETRIHEIICKPR